MSKTFMQGETVYTVNAKTNTIDAWAVEGFIPTTRGLLLVLDNGKKRGFFSRNCVFASKDEAQKVANL